MAGPLAFVKLYGTAQRTGYSSFYPNACTTGSAGTILQSTVDGTTALNIISFEHGDSFWFVICDPEGNPYQIGNSQPEAHGFAAGQTIYVDNSDGSMPSTEFANFSAGALNSGYYTIITGPATGDGGANLVALYENTSEVDVFIQPTGCNGNLNFSSAAITGIQDSTISVVVTRTKGSTGAVTCSIDGIGGDAVLNSDYEITTTRQNWEDGEDGNKTFTITTTNPWSVPSLNAVLDFYSIQGAFTGIIKPTTVLTMSNTAITEESARPYPDISTDFTINSYLNMSSDYRRKSIQVPFSFSTKGPSTIRKLNSAYSTSLG
tara:strand:- start:1637 stop:2593 length:957 start_codon:yes stop_codon:yes gene_type:complete